MHLWWHFVPLQKNEASYKCFSFFSFFFFIIPYDPIMNPLEFPGISSTSVRLVPLPHQNVHPSLQRSIYIPLELHLFNGICSKLIKLDCYGLMTCFKTRMVILSTKIGPLNDQKSGFEDSCTIVTRLSKRGTMVSRFSLFFFFFFDWRLRSIFFFPFAGYEPKQSS